MIGNGFGYNEVMYAVTSLVRSNELYESFKDRIEVQCFHIPEGGMYVGDAYDEYPLLLVWLGLKEYYESTGLDTPPTANMLIPYIQIALRRGGYFAEQRMTQYIWGTYGQPGGSTEGSLVAMMCDQTVEHDDVAGRKFIQDFLMERVVKRDMSRVLTYSSDVSQNLEAITQKATEINAIGGLSDIGISFPDQAFFDNLPQGTVKHTTGFPWLDQDMAGGQVAGECYGMLGFTGCGKTTTICTMAAAQARDAYYTDPDNPDKIVIYGYEQPTKDYMEKFWSGAAEIARESVSIESGTYRGLINPSTDPKNPKDYEREIWPNDAIRLSEVERLDRWCEIGNKTVLLRNFSGVPDYWETGELARKRMDIGRGGVAEIKNDLRRLQDHYGSKIRTVFIDYAGLLCQRQNAAAGEEQWAQYHALRILADELRNKVAGPYQCAVWVVHQLRISNETRSPLRYPTLADSDGCKSIANNMPYCYALGAPDKKRDQEGGTCFRFVQVKGRRSSANGSTDGRILQHHQYFDRVDDVTDKFRIDKATGHFVLKGKYRHA